MGYTDTSGGGQSITPGSGSSSHAQEPPPAPAPAAKAADSPTINEPIAIVTDTTNTGVEKVYVGSSIIVPDGTYSVDGETVITVSQTEVTINAAVNVNTEDNAVSVSGYRNANFKVNITGDLTTNGPNGIINIANAEVNQTQGDITAGNVGIWASGEAGMNAKVTTTGTVTTTGSSSYGIKADSVEEGSATVEAAGADSAGEGVYAEGGSTYSPGTSTVTVRGDILAKGTGIEAIVMGDGTANITADSVTSENGVGIKATNEGGNINITIGSVDQNFKLIGGTVTGGIQLGDGVTKDNTSITVWEVNGGVTGAQDVVNYLIRVADDKTSQSVFANYNIGDTMKSGTQQIKITIPEGCELTAAFADNGKTVPISLGKDGNYYADIPVSGAIYLSATLEEAPGEPEPDKKTEAPVIQVEYVSVKCTFDLDGGTLDGETGKVVKWYVPGATVKLPAAPAKDGFTFAGWQTKVGGEVKVFQAGDKFTVTAAQDFTALWE